MILTLRLNAKMKNCTIKKSKSVVKFGPTATEKKLDQQIMNLVSWNNITKREQKTEYIQTRIQEH